MNLKSAASLQAQEAARPSSTATASEYARLSTRRGLMLGAGVGVLFIGVVLDLLIGPAWLAVSDVLGALFGSADSVDRMVMVIVREIRLPMTMMALIVGASLGIAGAQMQTILGNPLASPYTLGFSAAAGFGAAVTILFGLELPLFPRVTVPVAAFAAAAGAAALVYGFSRLRGMTSEIMVLAGIATLFLFQSMQSLAQYLAAPEVLQEIVFWLFGSLLKATWLSVAVSGGICVVAVAAMLPDVWKLTALRLGDERASSLGVDVRRLRARAFVIVSLLTAGAVAFVGTIGFVGLVAPHLARMLVGEDHRVLLPMAACMGSVVMVGASLISKLVSPGSVVPIGIVTAVIGVPFLFLLILKGRRRFW